MRQSDNVRYDNKITRVLTKSYLNVILLYTKKYGFLDYTYMCKSYCCI